MQQAGHGDRNEPNQDEITVSFFIKRLVLREDSEYLDHNCKQKWRKGLGVPITSSPLLSFKLAEGPQSPAQRERRHRVSDTFVGPQGARGLGRSHWCPPGPRAATPQGSARLAVCSPD